MNCGPCTLNLFLKLLSRKVQPASFPFLFNQPQPFQINIHVLSSFYGNKGLRAVVDPPPESGGGVPPSLRELFRGEKNAGDYFAAQSPEVKQMA